MSFLPQLRMFFKYSNLLENNDFPLFLVTHGFIKRYFASYRKKRSSVRKQPFESVTSPLVCLPKLLYAN